MNRQGGGELPRPLLPAVRAAARCARVLDIACGTGPAPDPAGRARLPRCPGSTSRPRTSSSCGERAAGKGLDGELRGRRHDATSGSPRPVDAAICMQDSQGHLLTNEALLAHLRCVARSLRQGGLYVFDRYMCSSWTDPARRWSWTRRRGGAIVRATFEALKDVEPGHQVFYEDMELEAHENGTRRRLPAAPRLADGLPAGAARAGRAGRRVRVRASGSTASSPTSVLDERSPSPADGRRPPKALRPPPGRVADSVPTAARERRIRAGHPWIYRGEVADVGRLVRRPTRSTSSMRAGAILGRGFYNPRSTLVAASSRGRRARRRRVLPPPARGRAAAYRGAAGLVGAAYRLCWSEADGLPGLVVDRYGPGERRPVPHPRHGARAPTGVAAALDRSVPGRRRSTGSDDPTAAAHRGLRRRAAGSGAGRDES